MYRLGPLLVRPEAWPPSWAGCAQRWLTDAADDDDGTAITVAVTPHGLSADEAAAATTPEELLSGTRLGPAEWELRGKGQFVARYHEATCRMELRLGTPVGDPVLVLGNALRGLTATTLPSRCDGMMIHACAGILDGAGVLVAGVSTAGKSTLALGFERTRYLSDDVALVGDIHRGPMLEPSPFFGTAGHRGGDFRAPLRAIGVLVEKVTAAGGCTTLQRATRARATIELVRHVARFTFDRQLSERLFDLTVALTERVPVVLVRRSLADSSDHVIERILEEAGC